MVAIYDFSTSLEKRQDLNSNVSFYLQVRSEKLNIRRKSTLLFLIDFYFAFN